MNSLVLSTIQLASTVVGLVPHTYRGYLQGKAEHKAIWWNSPLGKTLQFKQQDQSINETTVVKFSPSYFLVY